MTTDLTFEKTKSSLKRIYRNNTTSSSTDGPTLKEEPAFATRQMVDLEQPADTASCLRNGEIGEEIQGSEIEGFQNRSYRAVGNRREQSSSQKQLNPFHNSVKVSTWAVCGSRYHWARNCPENTHVEPSREPPLKKRSKDPEDESEQVFLTLAISCSSLAKECAGKGILDTACTSSVAGEQWLKSYLEFYLQV